MSKSIISHITLLFLIHIIVGFSVPEKPINGDWKIETVTIQGDTLYFKDQRKYTVNFYNSFMSGWEKTEDDAEYIKKCHTTTYHSFRTAVLKIRKKKYTQTGIVPCWDHMTFEHVQSGKYTLENDQLELFKPDSSSFMRLTVSPDGEKLQYTDEVHEYSIVYIKQR